MTMSEDRAAAGRRAAANGGDDLAAEVLIVGGGLVGMSLAVALAGAGVAVSVLERGAPEAAAGSMADGRASAIAFASRRVLAAIGAWDGMAAAAQPILEIRVVDGGSPLFVHYDYREMAGRIDDAHPDGAPLGHIVENDAIRRSLAAAGARHDRLRIIAPCGGVALAADAAGVTARLDDGRQVRALLAVAADGRDSPTRAAAGIDVTRWRYRQSAIVCTVAHEKPHRGVAVERFLPAGPFAILPMTGDRSSIVWAEREDRAAALLALDDAAFLAELGWRFGDHLGAIEVVGRRWCYPLGMTHARRYAAPRLALVGDAAHAIHPISGQGYNLGLRDVAALAELVVDARRLGLDLGDAAVLDRYARWRRVDSLVLIAVTDGLNRLFSNDIAPLRLARDLGLAAVNLMPPARRLFMRHAMGLMGDLPRLTRGEAL